MSGLYVHIPWCVKKCPYCDFNSHAVRNGFDEPNYVSRLLDDLDEELDYVPMDIETVYFGGGTPSLFSAESFRQLVTHPALRSAEEITLESNPGTIERDSYSSYRSAGISRVSVGAQSFDPKQLHRLGRIHSDGEAKFAIQQATSAGFDSVNVDLMYGLPNQTREDAMQDLSRAIELEPDHISWYQLTIEPNTAFAHNPPVLPSDDFRAEISDAGCDLLAKAGYERYEVSAFARGGHQCRHNVNYWTYGDYIGIGAGAHGKFWLEDTLLRSMRPKMPLDYERGKPVIRSAVHRSELPVEFIMNALRLTRGVDYRVYEERTRLSINPLKPTLYELEASQLLEPGRLQLTGRGFEILDSVVAEFL